MGRKCFVTVTLCMVSGVLARRQPGLGLQKRETCVVRVDFLKLTHHRKRNGISEAQRIGA